MGIPTNPSDVEYFVEYFVAGKLVFIHEECQSIIPKRGEPIETVGGQRLRVLKVRSNPKLSRVTVDCEWAV